MPTTRVGKYGTYNQTVGVKLDMDDAIQILAPTDVPFQQWVSAEPTDQVKVEWLEEDLTPQTVTLTVVAGTASPWTVTLSTGEDILRPGDVLQKRDGTIGIQFRVTSVDNTASPPTAVVTSHGTTADTDDPVANDVWDLIGQYRDEGSDPEDARSVERTAKYNMTQWGQEKVEATRPARKRGLYGQGDPYDHEVGKKFKELAIRFERSMVYGQRAESSDKKRRFMGGAFYYITTNTVSNTVANAKTALNSLLRKCYEKGGSPTDLMCSPAIKEAVSMNVDPTLRRWDVNDRAAGSVVDRFLSDFGEVRITANRHFPKTKGLVMERPYIKRKVFDRYFHELLAKTGDADKGHIVGEFSLMVKNEAAHGILTLTDAA